MRPTGIFGLIILLVLALSASAPGEPQRSPRHDGPSPGKRTVMADRGATQGDTTTPRGLVGSPDASEPDRSPDSGIGCNWDGWEYARTVRDCWRCRAYTDTLRTYCNGGSVTRIEKVRVCVECWDGN